MTNDDEDGGRSSPRWIEPARRVATAETEHFAELCDLAGLDRANDFRFADLTGTKFDGDDLAGLDLTASRLIDCSFKGARIVGAVFDQAELGNVDSGKPLTDLTAAADYAEFERTWKPSPRAPADLSHLPWGAVYFIAPGVTRERRAGAVGLGLKAGDRMQLVPQTGVLRRDGNCFVIMPFSRKAGSISTDKNIGPIEVDFDHVYENLHKPALEAAGLVPVHVKDMPAEGSILGRMHSAIRDYEYTFVDATFLNPNVYYELGIRHAFWRTGTLIVKAEGTMMPFDIQDCDNHTYEIDRATGQVDNIERERERLTEFVRQLIKNGKSDSPVLRALNWNDESARKFRKPQTGTWRVAGGRDCRIGIRTGDLQDVKDIDVWVNSENTDMQMAQVHERTISSTIRYLSSELNLDGAIKRDWMPELLAGALRKERISTPVKLGYVAVTTSGALLNSHKVRAVLHVATVEGKPFKGFKVGPETDVYVHNAIVAMLALSRQRWFGGKPGLRHVVFPIMGAGDGAAPLEEACDLMVGGAIRGIREVTKMNGRALERVLILARNRRALKTLASSFKRHERLGDLAGYEGPPLEDLGQ